MSAGVLIHATHMTNQECQKARPFRCNSKDYARLQKLILVMGFSQLVDYLASGGIFGVGSDSHIRIDASEELRFA